MRVPRQEYGLNKKRDLRLVAELIEQEQARLDPVSDRLRVTELGAVLGRVREQLGENVSPDLDLSFARVAALESRSSELHRGDGGFGINDDPRR